MLPKQNQMLHRSCSKYHNEKHNKYQVLSNPGKYRIVQIFDKGNIDKLALREI